MGWGAGGVPSDAGPYIFIRRNIKSDKMSNWQKSVGKHYILHFMMRFRYQLFHDVPLKKQSNEESRIIILVFSQHHLFLPGKTTYFFQSSLGPLMQRSRRS